MPSGQGVGIEPGVASSGGDFGTTDLSTDGTSDLSTDVTGISLLRAARQGAFTPIHLTGEATSSVLDFYSGNGTDQSDRRLTDLWNFDWGQLELNHNYIQWLFPLLVPSGSNPTAPLLTRQDRAVFQRNLGLRTHVLASLELMLDFYGMVREVQGQNVVIRLTPAFEQRRLNWITLRNHNYLRISRILASLSLMGRGGDSAALYAVLRDTVYPRFGALIGAPTFAYWTAAANQ